MFEKGVPISKFQTQDVSTLRDPVQSTEDGFDLDEKLNDSKAKHQEIEHVA